MTKQQLARIHIMRHDLFEASDGRFTRADYDLILRNVGGVKPDAGGKISSKQLTNEGFQRAMAMLEWQLEKFRPQIGRYWRGNDDRKEAGLLSRNQEWEIFQLHRQLGAMSVSYEPNGMARRLSNHRVDRVEDLTPGEANNVIEAFKAAVARQPLFAGKR